MPGTWRKPSLRIAGHLRMSPEVMVLIESNNHVFTSAIITGRVGDECSIEGRWCYHEQGAALAALDAWDGTGEPAGWHRAPFTGLRRKDGDAAQEEVGW